MPAACPRCASGVVRVAVLTWDTPAGRGKSVYADEPLSCSRGCVLSPSQVERVLTAVYAAPLGAPGPAVQLPLFTEDAA